MDTLAGETNHPVCFYRTGEPVKVIAYTRVSTDEQATNGVGLEAQRRAITEECKKRDWARPHLETDTASGGLPWKKRPGLTRALCLAKRGDLLVVSRLDRLSRSIRDFVELLDRATREGWRLVVLDSSGLDMTTPTGRAMVHMMATFAQLERELIGQRVKDALAVKKAQGIRVGRPRKLDTRVRARIHRMSRRGTSPTAIARTLNAAGVPTAHGAARWSPPTVRRILQALA
jgi:DNA invertase Pin-like site-specific DNA recombinase